MLNYFTFNIFNIGLLLAVIIGIGLITSLITCIKALKSKPIKIIKIYRDKNKNSAKITAELLFSLNIQLIINY